ncbi:MAG: hypothetical protein Q8O68_00860 [Candidatus Daviesbacteria bacterium]|nr:hypothetical protein [Candidatus Daviesbacteria bacterium]
MKISALRSLIISHFSFLILILLSTFYFLSSASPTYAASQTATEIQSAAKVASANTNPDVPNNLHNWTQNVMIEVMSALTCQIAGFDPTNPDQSCLGTNQETGKIGFLPSPQAGGAIGFMGNMIATLYTPPIHTSDYFQNLAQNFGITKKTYAQTAGGTGFQGLIPLIDTWSAFRNIVYLVLIIIFVVIGLAIMLRMKIDPRTVMTIQNQIPKIIIGILAVTLSFAIAGFLIDMMWVFTYLIYAIFSGISGSNLNNLNPVSIQGQTAIEVAGHISAGGVGGIAWSITDGASTILKDFIGAERCNSVASCFNATLNPLNFVLKTTGIGFNGFDLIYDLISWTAGTAMYFKIMHMPTPEGGTPFVSDLISFIGFGSKMAGAIIAGTAVSASTQYLLREALPSIIIYVIVLIALLTALIKLWFILLMSYVEILLAVVLAPFWIIGGIVPGSPISLGGWLKNIGANLLAFPTVIAMFMLGNIFMYTFGNNTPNSATNFVPPLIGNPSEPSLIGSLIGLGIILMTPNVVNMLKQMLKAPKTDMGGAMKGIGAGAALPMKAGQSAGGIYGAATFDLSGEKRAAGRGGRIWQSLFRR